MAPANSAASVFQVTPPQDATRSQEELRAERLHRTAHTGRMSAAIGRGVAHELRNVAQLVGMLRDAMQHDLTVAAPLMDAISLADATLMRQIGTLERLPPFTRYSLPCNLAEIVERATELLRRRRRGAKMAFVVDVSRQLPPVMAIESDLEEAIWELLINAREAAEPRGHGTVHIRAEATETEVRLVIEDDGPGIHASVHEKLFEPFGTTQASEDHLGIGLSMVQRLVMDNGGTIEADLKVASGARFIVTLPTFQRHNSASLTILS